MTDQRSIDDRARGLSSRIHRLESRIEESDAADRKTLYRRLSSLRMKQERLLESIQTARLAGGEAWDSFEQDLEHRLDDLKRNVDRATMLIERGA